MKRKVIWAIFLAVTLLLGSVTAYADKNPMPSDQRSAYAGASLALSRYYAKYENAPERICGILQPLIDMKEKRESGGTADPIAFENPKIGVVCTLGNLTSVLQRPHFPKSSQRHIRKRNFMSTANISSTARSGTKCV